MSSSAMVQARADRFPIGDTLTLNQLRSDPVGIPALLREKEPVTWVPEAEAWCVSSHALTAEIYRSPDRFIKDFPGSSEKAHGDTMLTMDEPEHSLHRAPFNASLRPSFVRDHLAAMIDVHVNELLDELGNTTSADLVSELSAPLALRVIRDGFGFDFPDDSFLKTLLEHFMDALQTDADAAAWARMAESRSKIVPAVMRALQNHGNTVIGTLNDNRGPEHTDDLVVANILGLILGGAETTATMVGTTLWALLMHPAALEEVRADRSLVETAAREAMRWQPTFGLNVRAAAEDTELAGVKIKAGERVWPLLMGANRDPAAFTEPNKFDVHRKDLKKSLAFGLGVHLCIGQNLATSTTVSAVNACLDRLTGLRLDPDRPVEPGSFEFHRLPRLDVHWNATRS
jgi:cytochrome P450